MMKTGSIPALSQICTICGNLTMNAPIAFGSAKNVKRIVVSTANQK